MPRTNPHIAPVMAAWVVALFLAGWSAARAPSTLAVEGSWPATAEPGEPRLEPRSARGQPTMSPEPTGSPTGLQPSTTPSPSPSATQVAPPSATDEPTPTEGTPVVDPEPEPLPLFLPALVNLYDPHVPGPLPAEAIGYLRVLTVSGRDACAPATHVIVATDDQASPAVAVVYSLRPDDPTLELDLYLGSRVSVTGLEGLAPPECALTGRIIGVDRIEIIDVPGRE